MDTLGLVLTVVVHPASVADRDGARLVLDGVAERCPDLSKLWVDAGYRGSFVRWAREERGLDVEVVTRPRRWVRVPDGEEPLPLPTGVTVQPRRWVVERTFAWLGRNRRLSKDYEALCATEEAWVHLAMVHLMTTRIAR